MAVVIPRAAIVGAGPAGFYAAEQLLQADFEIDLIDALPTPFGLVRSGVAPDHPKIKSVTRVFEKTARRPGFRFAGGVKLGRELRREDLLRRYHAVVYAMGTPEGNRLGIPGEDRPGSYAATDFVSWYNGHPAAASADFNLDVERAVVVGNGNVAVDVARMLALAPEELRSTDAADHAIHDLLKSRVREIVVLGRRGPAQAAFTTPELRELSALRRAATVVDGAGLELDPASAAWLESQDATPRRNVELLRTFASEPDQEATHRIVLKFLRAPVEILGQGEAGPVSGVRTAINRIEPTPDGGLRAVPTGRYETIDCGVVLRAVGYRGQPVADLPFQPQRGTICNDQGRVIAPDGTRHPGEYAVGWIKRGPSGVIGTNKRDAFETVAKIREDRDRGLLNCPSIADRHRALSLLPSLTEDVVSWKGWRAIDDLEVAAGLPEGRPRVKVVDLGGLYTAARELSGQAR